MKKTIFSRILDGELPARLVFQDEICAAFLSIHPLRPGHTLVVPRLPVAHWIDLPSDILTHIMGMAQQLARVLAHAFPCEKVGLVIAGFEVQHVHLHVVPANAAQDLDFAQANIHPDPAALDANLTLIQAAWLRRGS